MVCYAGINISQKKIIFLMEGIELLCLAILIISNN